MYIMKWSERKGTGNHTSYKDKFVAIDYNSGGYPWAPETFSEAHIWTSLEEAQRYQKMFPELDIYELKVELNKI